MPEQDDDAATPETPGAAEDVRERFRAALDAKQARHHASESADPGDDAKAHGGSAPAKSQRQFRRKSG